jgi:hypothetical protein
MTNFCTLFDSNYLSRGLALYESLLEVSSSFHLYIVAFDDNCFQYLKAKNSKYITAISLKDFEDSELLAVKPTRSAAEYCWTCTPSVILFCLQKFNLDACTYLDADMLFYKDPMILLDEIGSNSILLTEHRYTKDYEQSEISGKYCVQFICFKNDSNGIIALNWWRNKCLEWCFSYAEDGKFGDQKYLDDWTARFNGVHVLQHLGGGVAPWNLQQYNFKNGLDQIEDIKSGLKFPLVFFHFHGSKFFLDQTASCCNPSYAITKQVKDDIYKPYFRKLIQIEENIRREGIQFNVTGARTFSPGKIKLILQFAKERLILWKIGNISFSQLITFHFKDHWNLIKLKDL